MTAFTVPLTPPHIDAASGVAATLPIGAHLVTPRRLYTHHGVYVGDGRVVHYAGLSRSYRPGPVEEVPLAEFANGYPVGVLAEARGPYTPAEVVARARSRLGENLYRLLDNNCEHFCAWCLSGEARSVQVDRLFAAIRTVLFGIAGRRALTAATIDA